ncbi:polyprotein pp62-like protein [Pacmanvirus S19]|nr:polyprotein pp62-like protein [Pacmanvirus S19]
MSAKKPGTFCSIPRYLDAHDREFLELVEATCTGGSLTSTRGRPGTTLVIPQDKAYRKKIADLAFSDKVEDANKASDMINALIFRGVYKSPGDWISQKDDIPNALYPPQHVEIDSASGKEIVFKSGARAVVDTDFKDSSKKGNLAVWKLISGEIPVTSDKPAKLKYAKIQKGKTGGYAVDNMISMGERYKIAVAVENAYRLHELQRRSGASLNGGHKDIYLEYTLSLVNYIMNVRKDTDLMYEKVLPVLSFDKIDFYLLVEPHKFNGSYLLDDALIHEWWLQKSPQINCRDIMKQVESMLAGGNGALCYSNRSAIMDALAVIRQKLCNQIDSRPRACVDEIAKLYDDFEKSNTLPGLDGKVYPNGISTYYMNEPGLKMIHDELRYLTYGAFKRLELEPTFDDSRYNELVNMIGECLHAASSVDRAGAHKLLNKNSIRYLISPTEKIEEIKIFVYSTMFMYMPMTETEAMNFSQKHSISRPDPNNIVVFNIAKDLYIQHQRVLSDSVGSNTKSIAEAIRSLNIDMLDPALRDELKRKLGM